MKTLINTLRKAFAAAARHRHFFGYALLTITPSVVMTFFQRLDFGAPMAQNLADLLFIASLAQVILLGVLLMFFGIPVIDERPEVIQRTVLTTNLSFTDKEGAEQFLTAISKEF